jgi:hypothetical protein
VCVAPLDARIDAGDVDFDLGEAFSQVLGVDVALGS